MNTSFHEWKDKTKEYREEGREGGREGGRTYLDRLGEGGVEEGDAVGQVLVQVDVLGEQVTHA